MVNSFYKVYGKTLIILGAIVASIGSIFGFPYFVQWNLFYIFGERIPKYGWGGPNNTAAMMLTDIFIFIIVIFLLTILVGYLLYKARKNKSNSKLIKFSFVTSIIAHSIMILDILLILMVCTIGSCGMGAAIILGFGSFIYIGLNSLVLILLLINHFKYN